MNTTYTATSAESRQWRETPLHTYLATLSTSNAATLQGLSPQASQDTINALLSRCDRGEVALASKTISIFLSVRSRHYGVLTLRMYGSSTTDTVLFTSAVLSTAHVDATGHHVRCAFLRDLSSPAPRALPGLCAPQHSSSRDVYRHACPPTPGGQLSVRFSLDPMPSRYRCSLAVSPTLHTSRRPRGTVV